MAEAPLPDPIQEFLEALRSANETNTDVMDILIDLHSQQLLTGDRIVARLREARQVKDNEAPAN